jgi:hypothetical protein
MPVQPGNAAVRADRAFPPDASTSDADACHARDPRGSIARRWDGGRIACLYAARQADIANGSAGRRTKGGA